MSTVVLKFEQSAGLRTTGAEPDVLAAAVQASPDPLAISENGQLVYANPSFMELMRPDRALSARNAGHFDSAWARTIFDCEGRKFELATVRREGTADETLHLALMGRLVGGVAHDFNNLLTGILLYCDLLQTKVPGASPLAGRIDEIRRAAEQGAGIIRQLMTLGREEQGAAQSTSFNHALQDLSPILRHLAGENIQISTDLAEDAGLVGISLAQAQQIILNLVLNARDAMPHGGSIDLQTHSRNFEGTGPGNRMFEFSAKDTGSGMDAKVAARIFEPFFTTKTNGRGTGMGLTTVRKIVEEAGGIVCVETDPGKGTRMVVRLPEIAAPKRESHGMKGRDLAGM